MNDLFSSLMTFFESLATQSDSEIPNSCDPVFQDCQEYEESSKSLDQESQPYDPGYAPIVLLSLSYVGHAFAPLLSIIIINYLTDAKATADEILTLALPIAITYFAFGLPLAITLIYMISFQALSPWLNNILAFLIEHWVSNISIVILVLILVVLLRAFFSASSTSGYLRLGIIYGLLGTLFQWLILRFSADSVRFVTPDWDKIEPAGYMCPSVMYLIGLCEYWEGSREPDNQQIDLEEEESKDLGQPDPKDRIPNKDADLVGF